MDKEKNYFEIFNSINVSGHTEEKNGLSYLSWVFAWEEVKKRFPDAQYTIYERDTEYGPVNYFTDGKTCWVKTGVTINGIEHVEELPVMDFKNKSITLENVTSFEVNKSIQRSITKACARHGLGLHVYAGSDLTSDEIEERDKPATKEQIAEVTKLAGEKKLPDVLAYYKLKKVEELTNQIATEIIDRIKSAKKETKKVTKNEDTK